MCSHALTLRLVSQNGSCSSKNFVSRVPSPYSPAASSSQQSRSLEVPRATGLPSGAAAVARGAGAVRVVVAGLGRPLDRVAQDLPREIGARVADREGVVQPAA